MRWRFAPMPAMATEPPQRIGLRWVEVYPLVDRLCPDTEDWLDLVQQLEVMEAAVLSPDYRPFIDDDDTP